MHACCVPGAHGLLLVPHLCLPMSTESTANIMAYHAILSSSYNPRPTNDFDWIYTLRIEPPSINLY